MATRTVHECDRCKRESKSASDLTPVSIGDRKSEVCKSCKGKLTSIMGGAEVEIPP